MTIIKSSNLKGKNRCKILREKSGINLETGKNENNVYAKAGIIKEAIKEALYKGWTDKWLEDTINNGFKELDYPTAETKAIHAADAYLQAERYLKSETRTPVPVSKGIVDCFGLTVEVMADFLFKGKVC